MNKSANARVNVFINAARSQAELEKLGAQADKTEKKLNGLTQGSKEWDKTNEALQKQRKAMQDLSDVIDGKVKPSLNQMSQAIKKTRNELNNLPVGSEQYLKKEAQLKQMTGQYEAHRQQINKVGGALAKTKELVKDYGVTAAAALGVGMLISGINNLLQKNAELSDSLAAVRKTTGMTIEEVEALNESFGKFDTRTPRSELLKIAQVAGQFGIAKEEIKDFVQSVDQAVVALGDEFGGGAEEVAKQLGSLQNLFADTSKLTAGDAIARIGSAINELGAAGSATGPEVAEFAKRIGALGNMAPSINETLGLGAAMQELGLSAQIASGGLTAVLLESAKRTNVLSKEMQQLLNSNPNEFLLKLAESFKGLSNTQLAAKMAELGISSQEAIKVMSLLANKTDLVREKQALANKSFSEATSLQKEFNTMNSTFGANLEKITKAINKLFVNSDLMKFFDFVTRAWAESLEPMEDFSKGLNDQTEALIKQQGTFNAYVGMLKDSNTTSSERARLIGLINDQYKDLLPNQITEKTTMAELAKIQDTVNAGLDKRIRLKASEAKLQEVASKQVANEIEMARLDDEIIKKQVEKKNYKSKTTYSPTGGGSVDMGGFGIQQAIEQMREQRKELAKANVELAAEYERVTRVTRSMGSDFVPNQAKEGKGISIPGDGPANMTEAILGTITEQDKAYNESLRKLGDYKANVDKIGAEVLAEALAADARERAAISAKYDELIRKAQEAAKAEKLNTALSKEQRLSLEKEYNDEVKVLNSLRAQELAELEVQQYQRHAEARFKGLQAEKEYLADVERLTLGYTQNQAQRDELELANLKDQHAKKLAEVQEHQAQMLANQELSEQDRIELSLKYDQQLQQLRDAQAAALEERRKELAKQAESQKGDAAASIAVAINPDSLEAERRAVEKHYEQLLEMAKKYNLDTTGLAQAKERDLAELDRKGMQSALDRDKVIADARMQMYSNIGNAIAGVANLASAAGEQGSEFQKAAALAQIAINTAVAISNAIAGASSAAATTGPGAPFVFAGYIASMIGSVVTAMAQATATLNNAQQAQGPRFSGPGFYEGGYTGSGTGQLDANGRMLAGVVHSNEYVIPAKLMQDPYVVNITKSLEALRLGQPANKTMTGNLEALMAQNNAIGQQMLQVMSQWPTHLKASVDPEEAARGIDQKNRQFNKALAGKGEIPMISQFYGSNSK